MQDSAEPRTKVSPGSQWIGFQPSAVFILQQPYFPMLPPWPDSLQPCASQLSAWLEEKGMEMKSLQDAEGKQAAQGAAPEVTSSCPFLWESAL